MYKKQKQKNVQKTLMDTVLDGFILCPETSLAVMVATNKLKLTHNELLEHCNELIARGMLCKHNNLYIPTEVALATNGGWERPVCPKRDLMIQQLTTFEQTIIDVCDEIIDHLEKNKTETIENVCLALHQASNIIHQSVAKLLVRERVLIKVKQDSVYIRLKTDPNSGENMCISQS